LVTVLTVAAASESINRSYSHIYLAEAYNLEGYVVARCSGTPPDRINRSDRYWFKNAVAGTEIIREALRVSLNWKTRELFSQHPFGNLLV
jgi:hypothetical protein